MGRPPMDSSKISLLRPHFYGAPWGAPHGGPPWERPIRSYGPIGMYGDVCTYLPIGMSRYLRIGPHGRRPMGGRPMGAFLDHFGVILGSFCLFGPFWYDFGIIFTTFQHHFGIILGLFYIIWDHFGIIFTIISGRFLVILPWCWHHFGVILGSFSDKFGIIFGTFLNQFGICFAPFYSNFVVILGTFWALLVYHVF
jgi:hypothetical protein